jgi:NAD(P)-dependent dehydrogenase (short-subunit alcohol dehydrogenase family)
MSTSPQLAGKVAIVTGGSRGIGLAIATALHGRGAAVVLNGLDQGRIDRAVRALPGALGIRADVRDPDDVAGLVRAAVERFGGLDILVNNAAVGVFGSVADLAHHEWRAVVDTNLTGVFQCCHAAIPHLRRRGGGWIINISSLAGKNSFPGGAAYCASKAALNAFSEALMQEVRYDGIRVSYVMPGSVRTAFAGHEVGDSAEWKLAPEDVAQVVLDLVGHDPRSLPSRVEMRPSRPPRK